MGTMNEFLEKYGSNTQSSNAWIFADKIPAGNFILIGFDEKKSTTGTEIPIMILEDTQNKIQQRLSLWTADKSTLANIEVGDMVTLSLNKQINKVALTKTSPMG